jgi:spermidine/putrescine transport system substrate-binding protein
MTKRKYLFVLLVAALLVISSVLSACGEKRVRLNVYNWGDYIDESVIKEFEKKYNIKVNYETYDSNEDMYIKVRSGSSSYDVCFPSDYMIQRMIKEDLLMEIDYDNIPNYKNISSRFTDPDFDPGSRFSVPYMWGTVGILYNTSMVDDEVDSWTILWDEKYSKQILMLDSQRDSIGVALKLLGFSMNTTKESELLAAKDLLIAQKPLVLAYVGDDVKSKMIAGEAALAVVWSGDAVYCQSENGDLEYAIPKEGTNFWVDGMVIPRTAKNKKEAELFINFLCDINIAFKNVDYIGYSSPINKVMDMLDEEMLENPAVNPGEEVLANAEVFVDVGDALRLYDRIWTEVLAD